jgi:hypothetical protein
MELRRFAENPIIRPHMDRRMGDNINGPSLIRVPEWLENPLGRYYLYFAHHQGIYVRLAYADRLEGPWTTYEPGTLQLEQTPAQRHIASPDLHIDERNHRLIMYYHGPVDPAKATVGSALADEFPTSDGQRTYVATSTDGIHFASGTEVLGSPYFRVFRWGDHTYALGMPGIFFRSGDGLTDFERGPTLFTRDMRHTAVKLDGNTLSVFYSNAHDCPEHILLSQVELTPDWMSWQASEPVSVLQPETECEGAECPLVPSERGSVHEPVCQLRDPGIYREGTKTYLLYSVAGERGIGIAEMVQD